VNNHYSPYHPAKARKRSQYGSMVGMDINESEELALFNLDNDGNAKSEVMPFLLM